MPDEYLPKKILPGELQGRKHSKGGKKKRYKDTRKASLKDFNTSTESWEQSVQDRDMWPASCEKALANTKTRESGPEVKTFFMLN